MADVAAKDGSQETLVNLIASNIGIFLLPLITEEKYVLRKIDTLIVYNKNLCVS
jgi:hypothetical protein